MSSHINSLLSLSLCPVLGEDYNHTEKTVTMPRCGRVACTTVVIIDDESIEQMEKVFVVNLETNFNLTDQIRFEETRTVVTITDNDGTLKKYNMHGIFDVVCCLINLHARLMSCIATGLYEDCMGV